MSQSEDIILSVHDITLKYSTRSSFFCRFEHTALSRLSFDLVRGETLGILGRNGCGKSTLLRVLAGIVEPTEGSITCSTKIRRALLTLGLGFRNDLSGRNNALLSSMLQGMTKSEAVDALEDICQFAELGEYFDQPVKSYSSGMRARLGFATAISNNVDILLIDEVLSVGDAHFRNKAREVMTEQLNGNQTVVFVSHNPQQVNMLCDRAFWLEDGVIKVIGDTAEVTKSYQEFIQCLDQVSNVHGKTNVVSFG